MTEKLKIRSPFDKSVPSRIVFTKPTMAKQSHKAECDINNIMKNYSKTGVIQHARDVQGSYGDFTGVADYHESMNKVIEAQSAFMNLPSKIRRRFGNDPALFLEFVNDPSNLEEAVELGILEKTPDIAAEGGQSKPDEQLKSVSPKGEKSPSKEKAAPGSKDGKTSEGTASSE